MRNPYFKQVKLLTWEMLYPNRILLYSIAAIILFDFLLNFSGNLSFNADGQSQDLVNTLNDLLYGSALLLAVYMSSHTEFNSRRERKGFPQRLFTLPVSTLTLFSIPVFLGLFLVELVFLLSNTFGTALVLITDPAWVALKLAVFMLTYQWVMWALEKFGSMRLVIIGIAGFVLTILDDPESGLWILILWGLAAYLATWRTIVVQRSGGGRLRTNISAFFQKTVDRMPAWRERFPSANSAQMWFEWRRAGFMLPLSVFAILILVILPLSILTRDYEGTTVTVLAAVLLLPLVLAAPIGKGFSKGDMWSEDMEIPAFMLVRPLSSHDLIVIKLKAAAVSTIITWAIVLLFLLAWLPLWANLDSLILLGNYLWEVQNHSVPAQLAVVTLVLLAGTLVTWRFMVSSLWIGLSRHRKLFVASTIPMLLILFVGIYAVVELQDWIRADFTRLSLVVWTAGLIVIAKFWLAAWSWRSIETAHFYKYLIVWALGTASMLILAILLWSAFRYVIGFDVSLIQSLFIFAALMIMPLTQIALAPKYLAANRHR